MYAYVVLVPPNGLPPPREALGHLDSTENFLDALERLSEAPPVDRAVALTTWLTFIADTNAYVSAMRREALREWRLSGASYDDVARRLGISKSRAQQLCAGLEKGGGD